MPAAISVTVDLEDHRPSTDHPLRYPELSLRLLDWFDERSIVATWFVVGTVAEAVPQLLRTIAARGHELALHGWDHEQLETLDAPTLLAGAQRGKALLEDLGQREVVGYRAPTFSLVPATVWATDVLADAGYRYSSSVLPTRNPLYAFPGAPQEPFRWPSGLVELPGTLVPAGPARFPLGGTYLRVLPAALLRRAGAQTSVPWLYCHAYDFDPDEPFWWEPVAGRLAPLLWVGRRRLWRKLDRLLAGRAGPPLRDRLDAVTTTWTPPAAVRP